MCTPSVISLSAAAQAGRSVFAFRNYGVPPIVILKYQLACVVLKSVFPFCHYGGPPIVISRSIATRNLEYAIAALNALEKQDFSPACSRIRNDREGMT